MIHSYSSPLANTATGLIYHEISMHTQQPVHIDCKRPARAGDLLSEKDFLHPYSVKISTVLLTYATEPSALLEAVLFMKSEATFVE